MATSFYSSYELANSAIDLNELQTRNRYIVLKTRNRGLNDVSTLDGSRIRWEDKQNVPQIQADGVPFIVLGNEVRECHQGKNRHNPVQKATPNMDHEYTATSGKSRRLVQNTKKSGCEAAVKIRTILKFPEFRVDDNATNWKKQKMATQLKNNFNQTTIREYQVFVFLPEADHHSCHSNIEFAGYCQQLDKRVIQEITRVVENGIHDTSVVKRLLEVYVEKDLSINEPRSNRRFYPTDKDIRNHIYLTVTSSRFSNDDQKNLKILLNKWLDEKQDCHFYFTPTLDEDSSTGDKANPFLFVFQTSFQQRLLMKYGQEIVLLDSTYKTTKYELPLFLLCVLTNVGYHVVASFVIGKETRSNIKEGLSIIKKWNPGWNPSFFMCDCDTREIGALETVFKGSSVYLCDFHREQAWERWTKDKKHGVSDKKQEVLSQLRKIANADSETIFEEELQIMTEMSVYKDNHDLQNYLQNNWLPEKKRWAFCFRSEIFNIKINTTNGLERQHKDFKYKYLKNFARGKSLCSMVSTLVEKFTAENEEKYKRLNICCLEEVRQYNISVPMFLQNRPRQFVVHCLNRLPPNVTHISIDNITSTSTKCFTVQSAETDNRYDIVYGEEIPHCTCPDWKRYHWPCKHLLAVITNIPSGSWDLLPQKYTSQPLFNLDTNFSDKPCNSETHSVENISPSNINTKSESALRNECVDIIKQISTGVYTLSSTDTLLKVKTMLQNVDTYIDNCVPTLSGLPIRQKLSRKQKMVTLNNSVQTPLDSQKKSKNLPDHCTMTELTSSENALFGRMEQKMVTLNNSIHTPLNSQKKSKNLPDHCTMTELTSSENALFGRMEHDIYPGINLDQHEIEVEKIWRQQHGTDSIIGRIGPHTISDTSIIQLKSLVSDDIIDCFLHLLAIRFSGVYHLTAVIFTAIFNGMETVHGLLRGVNLNTYEHIIAAVNEGGNHWTLVIIQPSSKRIYYFNPLGETYESAQQLCNCWSKFMQLRYENHIDVEPPGQWSTVSVPHARQPNGDSCGVLVMKIAENFLSGRSVLFSMTRADLINFRKRLGAFLIFQTGATNINTILMQDSVEDGATSVQDGATSVQDGATSVEDGATSVENGATSVEDGATQSTEQSKESAHKPALKMRKCKRKKIDTEKPESPEQASYTMRSSRKKKRPSSFIFPDITAGKHTYCVCQKKNDGELYWQCCVCLRWYHPMCIGRNEHEEPEFFKCNNCEMEDGRCQKKPKITSIHAVIHCEELDDLEAAIMAHLTAILGCKREMCKELSHQRHHEFESKPFQVLDRERRFHCFGTDIFIDKTIESITTDIKNSLMYTYTDPKHPYTGFPTRKFKPVNDESELGKVFSQNKLIADNYLLYVALKEALIFIVCVKKHCTYAESEKLCTESEVDVANLLKKKPVK